MPTHGGVNSGSTERAVCIAKENGGKATGAALIKSEENGRASLSSDEATYICNSSDCKDTTMEKLDAPAVSFGGAGISDEAPYATVVVLTGHYYKKATPHNEHGPHNESSKVSKIPEEKGPVC